MFQASDEDEEETTTSLMSFGTSALDTEESENSNVSKFSVLDETVNTDEFSVLEETCSLEDFSILDQLSDSLMLAAKYAFADGILDF